MKEYKYILDANVLITAARNFYSFDFGNNFWNFLVKEAINNRILSIDKVLEEIKNGNDQLKQWAVNEFNKFFISTQSEEVLENFIKLTEWANKQTQYKHSAIDDFISGNNADIWILSFAMTNKEDYIIVTFEVYNPEIKRKIPIPNVCQDFDIKYCNLFKMLKDLNFKF